MIRNPNSEKNEEADLWNQTNIKLLHQKAKRRKFHIVSHIDNIRLPLTKVPSDSTNDNHNDHNNRFQINEDSKQTNDPLPKRRQKNVKKDNLDLVEPKTQMNWVLVLFLLLFVGLVIYLKYNAEEYDPDWNTFVNYYKILGVDSTASDETVKRAYHRLSLKWHPDKNPGCSECTEKYLEIQEAYKNIQKYGTYYKTKRAINFQSIPVRHTTRKENDDK